jgi:hypothetical protein
MDFFSLGLLNLRFMKTQWKDMKNLSLDANMIRTLLFIDENKTVAQICNEAGDNLLRFRETLHKLWRTGLIVPVNSNFECRCHRLIEMIVRHRSQGNPAVVKSIKAKLHLKGIDPNRFYPGAYDDPVALKKLTVIARNLGVSIAADDASPSMQPSRGMTRLVIDSIITQRSQGNPGIARNLRAKLVLKGINPQDHTYDTVDDPQILTRAMSLAKKLGISVSKPAAASSRGRIHQLIRAVIEKRAGGNVAIERIMRAKFILKGIDPDRFGPQALDDPVILKKMTAIGKSFGIDPDRLVAVGVKVTRGRAKYIIQAIIDQKSKGNQKTARMIRDKFMQKGLDPDKFTENTKDDPVLLKKLKALAASLRVSL